MPSNHIVPLAEIKNLRPHPNADRLEIAEVLGWQIVVGKDLYQEGERIVYVPPDSVMPLSLSDALEITKFLSNGRVRQAKLRGEPSFGATVPLGLAKELGVDIRQPLGTNVAEALGITKYEAPLRPQAGDAETPNSLFEKYTSIDNIRNYPDVFQEGEEVLLTEKIHGTNCRVGFIEGEWVAGSHAVQRKRPDNLETNTYWYPLSLESVNNLLLSFYAKGHNQIILFGEVYGSVQKKYHYGAKGKLGFRAFDLYVDGKYLDYKEFTEVCQLHSVEIVPTLSAIKYTFDGVVKFVESFTHSLMSEEHPMEGAVIRPFKERFDPKIGRVILKYISNAYLFDKGGSDFKDE